MFYRRKTSAAEHLAGIISALFGVVLLAVVIFWYRFHSFDAVLPAPSAAARIAGKKTVPIKATLIDTATLKRKIQAIEEKQAAKAQAQQEKIKQEAALKAAQKKAAEDKEKAEQEKAAKEQATKEKAAKEKAAKEKAAKEQAAKEKAAKEKAAKEKAAKEKAAKEKAAKEKAAKVKAAKEKAAREKAAKEKAAKEKAAKEKAAREKAAREKAAREKAARAMAAELLSQAEAVEKDAAISELENYANGPLRDKMRKFWNMPPNLSSGLSVSLFIQTDRRGNIVNISVDKSSGVPIFDSAAVNAVKRAAPLPLPTNPKAIELLVTTGIIATFVP